VDTFLIYTDSETWAGTIHPHQALERYRQKMGIPARLAVIGMTSNGFSIANSNDAGELDCVGFDTSTPQLLTEFSAGRL
jgi:60 kDa SS-A/Ro ribonucleoprotein